MHPSLVRLLELAADDTRGTARAVTTHSDLARYLNESPQVISNWKTRGVSKDAAIEIEKNFGFALQYIRDGFGPKRVAQSVSEPAPYYAQQEGPKRVEWGVMTYDELPDFYEVVMPDNAMADRVKKGNRVRIKKQRTARADQGILVANAAGDWFFRSYIPMGGERFRAAPLNKDYGPPLDSEVDGLQILGVRISHTSDEEWG